MLNWEGREASWVITNWKKSRIHSWIGLHYNSPHEDKRISAIERQNARVGWLTIWKSSSKDQDGHLQVTTGIDFLDGESLWKWGQNEVHSLVPSACVKMTWGLTGGDAEWGEQGANIAKGWEGATRWPGHAYNKLVKRENSTVWSWKVLWSWSEECSVEVRKTFSCSTPCNVGDVGISFL